MTEIIGMEIAILVVTISIVLSGIIIGLGRAFSIKKVELFGFEELTQSIINGALIGGIAVIIEVIQTISKDLIEPSCSTDSLIKGVECNFSLLSGHLFLFSQELTKLTVMLGYYQSLILDFSAFEIQPFVNIGAISTTFSFHLLLSSVLIILLNLNLQILSFFSENSLMLFLPIGLVFRSFFATRKLGGFLIAFSIGAYLFYPAFISIFPVPLEEINATNSNITAFVNNSMYATVPIIDLNDNYVIGEKLDNMSSANFVGDLTMIEQRSSKSLSDISFYSVFSPIFSFLITLVFIRELGNVLGGSMSFSWGVI